MPAYFRPDTLDAALEILARQRVTVLAGGTDVYPARTARAGWGDMRHPDVLDLSAINGLRGISEEKDHLRFGCLTTWTDLRRAKLPPAFAGYQAAACAVGGVQVQNRATLVGNICTASPAGDGIPCLLTLEAEVELASPSGCRRLPIADFLLGYRATARRDDEIVTALLFPRPDQGAQGGFRKLGARRYLVISIVMAAAVFATDEQGTVTSARIAIGACTPVAKRLTTLENALLGQSLEAAPAILAAEHLAQLQPIDDIRASGAFRRSAALALVRDLLADLAAGRERRAA